MFFWKNSEVLKQKLIVYEESSGGDMRGSSHYFTVRKYDNERALVTRSDAECHNMDPTVREYFADVKVLEDIKHLVKKYHMYAWEGKKFTNLFIADGASYSYCFRFAKKSVRFSSQHYSAGYSKKLKAITNVIDGYMKSAKALPGLVTVKMTEEEAFNEECPKDGTVSLKVYCYAGNRLKYRICNGTDAEIEFEDSYTLTNLDTGEVLATNEGEEIFRNSVSPYDRDSEQIELKKRLEEGRYLLKVDDFSSEFEIRYN